MLVGGSALAFVPYGGPGGPGTPPVASISVTARLGTTPQSVVPVAFELSAVVPLPAGGVFVPLAEFNFSAILGQVPVSTATIGFVFSAPTPLQIPRFCPQHLFFGYTSDGTNISIPIAKLSGLDAGEADTTDGDCREILQAILLRAVEYHQSFVWSDQARTYESFKMDLLNSRTFDRHFLTHFHVNMGEANVAPEP